MVMDGYPSAAYHPLSAGLNDSCADYRFLHDPRLPPPSLSVLSPVDFGR